MPPSRGPIWLVAILTLLVYAPALTNEFVSWDDGQTIYSNPRLNPATVGKNLWYWSHPENGEYLPLTRTVWALLTPIARVTQPDDRGITLNPWIYHGASLIVHTVSALLVYLILVRVLRRPPAADTPCSRQAVAPAAPRQGKLRHAVEPTPPRIWPAAAGALLFAIHPLQVEAVAWASGLKDLLFGLFALAAILAYLHYASDYKWWTGLRNGREHGPHPGPLPEGEGARRLFYLLGLLALLASMLSKPMGVITPLPAALLGWRLCHRPLRQVMRELAPWFALSVIFGLLARHWMPATAIPTTALWTRPLIAADSLAFYLFKLAWPVNLAIDYGRTPLAVMSSGWGYFTWIVPAIIAALLWRIRRKHPLPGVGASLAALAALPILGLTPHMFQYYSTVADHYAYLPMLGVAIAAAYGLSLLRARTSAIVATCILTALGIRSMTQTQNWIGNRQLWSHTLSVNPDSYVAMVSLAQEAMDTNASDA
ncbi:MAG: hypothetical protein ACHRHE_19415, partial [Tepidisphaerales bacterium]